MSIKCQRCNTSMQTVFYEGFAIKFCFSCKGIFLNKEKLAAIEESREIEISEDTPKSRNGLEISRNCPECKTLMKKQQHGNIRTTMIDYCEDCSGVWFDKGELASIQLGFETAANNKIRNQFRRI